jgi:hypothetical protein
MKNISKIVQAKMSTKGLCLLCWTSITSDYFLHWDVYNDLVKNHIRFDNMVE